MELEIKKHDEKHKRKLESPNVLLMLRERAFIKSCLQFADESKYKVIDLVNLRVIQSKY